MANQGLLEIIEKNPIGGGLDAFILLFGFLCKIKKIPSSIESLTQLGDEDVQDLASSLLTTLQILPIIRLLPSRTGSGSLRSDLLKLISAVTSNNFDFGRIKPLLRVVIAKEPDEKIWDQVYNVLAESTTPRPIASHFGQAPSSRSLPNSSEHRIDTDDVLNGPMYVDIPGFYDAFFGMIPNLENASKAIFKRCCEGPSPLFCEGWTGWPRDANQASVRSWLQAIIEQLMQWAQNDRQTPDRGLWANGSTAKRKLSVGIVRHPDALTDCSQVLVPGELRSNPKEDRQTDTWFDIGKYVREVFFSQDTRRFVLAFTLCGPIMRVWEFDRLGGIASLPFDINKGKGGLQLVWTILGFLWMEEKDLGFDPTIMTLNNVQYIDIIRDGTPERIIIDGLMGRVRCITGRATTCWKAHPRGGSPITLVIKDSWQYLEQDAEGELFREITEKGVSNVAKYYHHYTIHINNSVDDIQHGIRKGLDITKASNYQPQGLDTIRTAGQKKSSGQTSARLPSNKRRRSESPIEVNPVRRSILENRVHRRVIVRDYGRSIYEASSRVALLAALEGCIKGLKSLYEAGILHRDISINNLLINEDESNLSWYGFLIDLDLAIKKRREGASGVKAGTRAFMAIGVLRGEQHSFKHDLESFFWVIFWIGIHYDGPGNSRVVSNFDHWNYATTDKLAALKMGTISDEEFFIEILTKNFTPYYQPLIPWVNKLRKVVFDKQGVEQTLYSRIQDVIREAQKDEKVLSNATRNY